MGEQRFKATKHAQEQFAKRFPKIAQEGDQHTLMRLFNDAKDMPSVFNNTAYMVYHMQRYGDFDTRYFEHGDIVFVVQMKAKLILTVLDRRTDENFGVFRNHIPAKRFRKTT